MTSCPTCGRIGGGHAWWCGIPEPSCDCGAIFINPACTDHGHMIPADKCPDCGSVTIAHDLRCPVIAA